MPSRRMVVTAFKITQTVDLWESSTGISSATIRYRIRAGWRPERALTEKAVNGNNQFLRY